MVDTKLQELPRKQAHFCLEVLYFIKSLSFTLENKKIIIALSGGLDSCALLLFFALIKEKFQLELLALHVNHSLREEADKEALHVEKICKDLEIPLIIHKKDVRALAKKEKKGIEEMAREVRYAFFTKELTEKKFDYITLGHHLNDLAEDVLMRQIRGVGLLQAMGMTALDKNRKLLRPFLLSEKELLKNFLQACNFSWVEDSSNASHEFLRNRVRLEILPLFLKENPSYLKQIKNNWLQGQAEKDFWQKKVAPYIEDLQKHESLNVLKRPKKFNLKRKALQSEEKAARLKVLAKVLEIFKAQSSTELLFRLDALVMKNESNKHIDINNNLKVKIHKEDIEFKME